MKFQGIAHVFGDDVNTDYIIAGKYRSKTISEMAQHLMEDLQPGFIDTVNKGDLIVAGFDFGSGSSREYAPRVIKEAGISGVVAKSFSRIFYRNAINTGLPVVEINTDGMETGDELSVDLERGIVVNKTKDWTRSFLPLPKVVMQILLDGGLVENLRKNKGFSI